MESAIVLSFELADRVHVLTAGQAMKLAADLLEAALTEMPLGGAGFKPGKITPRLRLLAGGAS